MARTRATAVSALILALGLTGAGAVPFVLQSASASAVAYDPAVEPCEAGEVCDITPETTVTVTTTLDTPTPDPETTITKTVTAPTKTTTKTSTPKQSKTPSSTPSTPKTTPSQLQSLPSQNVEVPTATTTSSTPEPTDTDVVLPTVAPVETPSTTPSPSLTESSTEESVPLELRNAAPEYDQRTLTQQLSIPALVLVLLVLFAVLIFEGRLRRMAHAAAVRKAGPQGGPGQPGFPGAPGGPGGMGYPAGPGYATAGFAAPGYPGGTAYAPIISFVPVQTYPGGQVQYGAVYQDPNMYGQPAQPPMAAGEPMVLHPDEFDTFSQEPAKSDFDAFSRPEPQGESYRAPFEALVPAEQPPADIPPGGAGPYEDSPERPLGAASAAETGDAEPWQSIGQPRPGAEGPGAGGPTLEGPTLEGLAADGAPADVTAIQPLPPQKPKRRWGRRS
ncbi:hypothetical protein ACIBO2_22375 [Nonomuraea sp. NPDC050022]|uniref:hypothetical protein n=1 Tax=unclassified Nonomuraea TaxID=2593643 RepID=UPI0033FB4C6D